MNDDTKDGMKDLLSKAIEKSSDLNYSAFDADELPKDAKQHARGLLKMFLLATILGLVVGIFIMNTAKNADSSAITLGMALVVFPVAGLYFLISGKAMLKPGISEYSVFYGWKARCLGLASLLFGMFVWYKILFNPG